MKRQTLVLCALLCVALQAIARERPNILLVLVDDLRHDAFDHAIYPFFRSPNADRLADEGARFEDAFVITSLCSPSRATILSGLYTHEHGVDGIWSSLGDSTSLFVQHLHDAGYETAWVGKWHLGSGDAPHPAFDHWVSFRGQGSYADPLLNVDGTRVRATGHMTDVLTDRALRFLGQPRDRPFFLGLSHRAAHAPYLAQRRHHGRYDRVRIRPPAGARADRSAQPGFLECRATDLDRLDEVVRGYFELLAGVDESLGRILAALETSGELDRTLVIFTSDNGYLLGEHGLSDKRAAYEPSIRIPLLLRYPPWFAPGSVVRGTLALNLDIAVTALEAADLMRPPGMRGISLRDQARGIARRREFLYLYDREENDQNPRARCTPSLFALRNAKEKLVIYPWAGEAIEYYDLAEDPLELHNRGADPAVAERVLQLRTRMDALADSLGVNIAADAPED